MSGVSNNPPFGTNFNFQAPPPFAPGDIGSTAVNGAHTEQNVVITFAEFFRSRTLAEQFDDLILRAGQKLVLSDIELVPGDEETLTNLLKVLTRVKSEFLRALPPADFYRMTNNDQRKPCIKFGPQNQNGICDVQVKRETVGTSISSTQDFCMGVSWIDKGMSETSDLPSPPSVKTFSAVRFKRTLQDNEQLTFPGSKIISIDEMPIEDCFQAELDMIQNVGTAKIINNLFQSCVGRGQEKTTFGTLGFVAVAVSPEECKWGIVSNEPMYISLNPGITYTIDLRPLSKKMFLNIIPNELLFHNNDKLLLKHTFIHTQNKPDGTPTEETIRRYLNSIREIMTEVGSSLSQEENQIATGNGQYLLAANAGGVDPCRITRTNEGMLVAFKGDHYIRVLKISGITLTHHL